MDWKEATRNVQQQLNWFLQIYLASKPSIQYRGDHIIRNSADQPEKAKKKKKKKFGTDGMFFDGRVNICLQINSGTIPGA